MFKHLKRFWNFLKKDTWQSWLVSLVLVFVFIKFIFFPVLSFAFDTRLPLVVVESCSMYHEAGFDYWWDQNSAWYESNKITKEQFEKYPFKNGINKGDIVIVTGRGDYDVGDVIIFDSSYAYPLIHRLVDGSPLGTKGDHNGAQLPEEREIQRSTVLGHAVLRIPALGWIKLIFFEGFKEKEQRGFCR